MYRAQEGFISARNTNYTGFCALLRLRQLCLVSDGTFQNCTGCRWTIALAKRKSSRSRRASSSTRLQRQRLPFRQRRSKRRPRLRLLWAQRQTCSYVDFALQIGVWRSATVILVRVSRMSNSVSGECRLKGADFRGPSSAPSFANSKLESKTPFSCSSVFRQA